jgi:hypothetical protein
MISPDDLKKAGTYFLLGYLDPELKYPTIETYVYIGASQVGERSSWYWRFQLAKTFLTSPSAEEQPVSTCDDILSLDRLGLSTMFSWSGLLDELHENQVAQLAGGSLASR